MPTYYCDPKPSDNPGGVTEVLLAHAHWLPKYGWRERKQESKAKLVTGHLGTESKRLDVFHLHGLYPTATIDFEPPFWRMNAKVIENIRRAKRVIAVSDWVAQSLRRDMHLSPWVLGHGINPKEWLGIPKSDHSEHAYVLWNKTRRYGVCDPAPVLDLAKSLPRTKFVTTFLSSGMDQPPENVRVTGLLPRLAARQVVRDAKIYLATTKETFGIGILEAMISGCVVIGYNWGAVPEILDDCGILVEPGDIDALVVAYWEALARHDELAQRARSRVQSYYTWETVVKRLAAYYKLALKGLVQKSPRVSVIVPNFNYAKFITQAIESVRSQTYQDWELIIIDDGSTDDSIDVIRGTITNEPRARLLTQPNMGVAHARNNGIAQARGEYICCLDADDAMAPNLLAVLVPALDQDQSLGIAYTGIRIMSSIGELSPKTHSWPQPYDRERGVKGNQVPTCCLYRKSWWTRLGGYRQRYAPHGAGQEDGDFWLRILANGGSAKMVSPKGLLHYRLHKGQTSNVNRGDFKENSYNAWHPYIQDCQHPLSSQLAIPRKDSWPVHDYDQPKISVIVPIGPGHESVYTDALDSVEAQTYRAWELIVVNDTGGELNFTPWPFAKVVVTSGGIGAGAARNAGARLARSPLLVFLDADDFLQPRFLESTLRVYLKNPDYWVYTDLVTVRDSGKLENYNVHDWDVRRLHRRGIAGVTCLYTKEQWASVGGFDEVSTREDWDFHLRLAMKGHCGIHLPEYLYTYRHATGKRRDEGTKKQEILIIHEKYDLEDLKMACKGCGDKRGVVASTQPANWESKGDTGFVHLEYTGKNQNDLTFKGPSGRRYLFGNNDYHRYTYVYPGDVRHLLSFRCFRESGQAPPQGQDGPITAPLRAISEPRAVPPKPIEKEPVIPVLTAAPVPAPVVEPPSVIITPVAEVTKVAKVQKTPESTIVSISKAIVEPVAESPTEPRSLPKDPEDDTLMSESKPVAALDGIFNITEITLAELKNLDLSDHEIDNLIQLERATKNRRTVLAHLRRTQRALTGVSTRRRSHA